MTDEQINIAIAESLGIEVKPCTCTTSPWIDAKTRKHIMSYTSDLNACHEFEKSLNTDDAHMYYWRLKQEIGWGYASATASQRCKNYLKTIGKWIE